MKFQVNSEVGHLNRVLIHRPGKEMTRLTPSNKDELLFDDLLWLEQAQKDHDVFAQILRDRGAEVLYLTDLLAETMEIPQARKFVLDETFEERWYGLGANDAMREWADSLNGIELAQMLIGGITKEELLTHNPNVRSAVLDMEDLDFMSLRCLPNHLFTRDTSCWIYDGVAVNSMQMVARQRETINLDAIYRWHPMFKDAPFQRWQHGLSEGAATIEGGDVHIIGNGSVMIGMSERTKPAGVERLARNLFEKGSAERVLGICMPSARAVMHLDTVMTMVDRDTFTYYGNLGNLGSCTITPGSGDKINVQYNEPEDMFKAVAQAVGVDSVRILTTPTDRLSAERDQWNDSCNLLTVSPGVVVAYDRNVTANDYLRDQGLTVLEVPGAELGRGRGGPRCMSCPIDRDA